MDDIFAQAAPRMSMVRELLELKSEDYEYVDFLDFVGVMKNMCENDKDLFQKRFPSLQSKNVLHTKTYDEDVTKGCTLPDMKKRIEDVLRKDKKCAVSIVYNEHIVTGCFIAKVEFHDCR